MATRNKSRANIEKQLAEIRIRDKKSQNDYDMMRLAHDDILVEGLGDYRNEVVEKHLSDKRKTQHRVHLKIFLIAEIIVAFLLVSVVTIRNASITELGYKVASANNEYKQIVAENEQLEISLQGKMNTENIKEIAGEKFDMQLPQTYQMVVLNVTPIDQTEYYEAKKGTEQDDKIWYERIFDAVRDFLGITDK